METQTNDNSKDRKERKEFDNCIDSWSLPSFLYKDRKNRYPGTQNKFNQVELISNNSGDEIHILGLSKTKLKDFHPDSYFNIENYKLFRKDRILQGKEESEEEGLLCM